MAAEQSGAEASPGAAKPADAARQADDQAGEAAVSRHDSAKPDLDEVKRKFRDALERKRSAHASASAEEAHDTGKVHGSHGPAGTRRSFRRKSG